MAICKENLFASLGLWQVIHAMQWCFNCVSRRNKRRLKHLKKFSCFLGKLKLLLIIGKQLFHVCSEPGWQDMETLASLACEQTHLFGYREPVAAPRPNKWACSQAIASHADALRLVWRCYAIGRRNLIFIIIINHSRFIKFLAVRLFDSLPRRRSRDKPKSVCAGG